MQLLLYCLDFLFFSRSNSCWFPRPGVVCVPLRVLGTALGGTRGGAGRRRTVMAWSDECWWQPHAASPPPLHRHSPLHAAHRHAPLGLCLAGLNTPHVEGGTLQKGYPPEGVDSLKRLKTPALDISGCIQRGTLGWGLLIERSIRYLRLDSEVLSDSLCWPSLWCGSTHKTLAKLPLPWPSLFVA